ncbi:phosphorylase family protein [Pseudomonas syringae]|uniref:5'-methylthioadenosine/S-adenosylhomocysteine nucleosidase family protein n=1 Tax=Pseudomonas syringae TaxID=317 RepID=UPI0006E635C5|nr:hypothetical protein [Pseudomonas syringae]KPY27831.1 Uncharacterized protein ALO65_00602 [Pseudomonas syringae pv. papulans]RMN50202.1 hypothetical protein ALQ60_02254 [Pseudomonas syringae pv. papulans]RMN58834.1 hypothetical protein ALQ56_04050 [Pseudomonas syringae pv. papulans]RMV34991.1 hypothetical protein ALP11_04283 [Pseudomonas syringae pv. papulans]
MILDISIPLTSDLDPSPEGGVLLLDEILARDIYNRPREVIGLTAFQAVKTTSDAKFNSELWTVLHYTPGNDEWLQQIQRKVKHIIANKSSSSTDAVLSADICIITALYRPELTAVLNLPWDWEVLSVERDPTEYHCGSFSGKDQRLTAVAACASRMGMPAAAVLAMKMITTFKPKYLVMTGITAGVAGKVELGDIIVADPSWDYGSGKRTSGEEGAIFESAPHQLGLDPLIRGKLQRFSRDMQQLNNIRLGWPVQTPPLLTLHIGPLASGASVLEDPDITESIQGQHRKLLGVEMEAYGVFAAANEAPYPQPIVLALKSVCDFANADKSDGYQDYASYTSAKAFQLFAEQYL